MWGRRALSPAKVEETRRGGQRARLWTLDYPASAFYQRLGYRVVGQVEGFPAADTIVYLRRDLGRDAPGIDA